VGQQVTLTISAEDSASQIFAKVTQGLDSLGKKAEESGKKIQDSQKESVSAFQQLQNSLEHTANGFRQLMDPATLFGTFIGYKLVHAFKEASAEVVDYVRELKRLSLVTDASTTELAALQKAAGDVGVDTSVLQRAFFMLSNEIETGGSGLAKFGVSVRDSSGHMKGQVKILGEIAEGMKNMTGKNAALNAVRDTFSRQGLALMPLLTQFKERMAEATEEVEKMGLGIDNLTKKKFTDWQRQLHDIGEAETAIKLQIFKDLLPILTAIATAMKTTSESLAVFGNTEVGGVIKQFAAISIAVAALTTLFLGLKAVLIKLGIGALITAVGMLTPEIIAVGAAITGVILAWNTWKDVAAGFFNWFKNTALVTTVEGWIADQTRRLENFFRWIRGKQSIEEEALMKRRQDILEEIEKRNAPPDPISAGALQKQMQLIQQLSQAQMQLAQATLSPAKAAEISANKQIELQELQLAAGIKAGTLQVSDAKEAADKVDAIAQEAMKKKITYEQLHEAAVKSIMASVAKAQAQEAEQDIQKAKQIGSAKINLLSAGEDAIRQQAELDKKTVQAVYDNQLKYGLDRTQAEKTRANEIELINTNLAVKLRDIDSQRFEHAVDLSKKDIDLQQQRAENEKTLVLKALDDETKAVQQSYEDRHISQYQSTDELVQLSEKRLQIELDFIEKAKNAAQNAAGLEIAKQAQKKQDQVDYSLAVQGIQKDLESKIEALRQQGVLAEQEAEQKKLEYFRQARAIQQSVLKAALDADEQATIDYLNELRLQYLGYTKMLQEIDSRLYQTREQMRQNDIKKAANAIIENSHAMSKALDQETASQISAFNSIEQLVNEKIKLLQIDRERIDALQEMKKLSPIEADLQRLSLLQKEQQFWSELLDTQKESPVIVALIKEKILELDTSMYKLKETSLSMAAQFKNAFEGITDIMSLFGVKVGKVILMLQQIPKALGGLEKIARAIGGMVSLSASPAAAAQLQWTGATEAISNIKTLGDTAQVASGDVGIFGSVLGWASKLLSIFGGGLQAFGSKIGSLLSQAGVPGAELLGQGAAGGMLGFGMGSMFGGTSATIIGGIGGMVGNMILPGIGGVVGSIIGSLGGKLSDVISNAIWDGNKAAQMGSMVGTILLPGIGTLIGGFIGSLFGSTPKGKIEASIYPFSRNALRSDFEDVPEPGVRVGDVRAYVGGNVLKNSKEQELKRSLADALNKLFHGIVENAVQLMTILPERLGAELDAAMTVLEETGLEIVDKKWKGGKAGKKLKKRIQGLADEAVSDIVAALGFGDLDLKALGGGEKGDAVKGFDALMTSLSVMSTLLKDAGANMDGYTGTLADFTKITVDYFKQFQQEGEAFTDTVKRVGEALLTISAMSSAIDEAVASISTDTDEITASLRRMMDRATESVTKAADALTVSIESGDSPEQIAKAAQAAVQAVSDAYQQQVTIASRLHDAVMAINKELTTAAELFFTISAERGALSPWSATAITGEVGAYVTSASSSPVDVARQLWQEFDDVNSRLALFGSAFKAWGSDVTTFNATLPQLKSAFNTLILQIHGMASAAEAVSALQTLYQNTEAGFAAIRQATAAAFQAERTAAQQASDARIADLNAEKQAIQDASNARIDALETERKTIQDSLKVQIDALNDQKRAIQDANRAEIDALQKELQLAQDWQRIAEAVKSQLDAITDLLAPTHPQTSLDLLKAQFEEAYSAFQASPSAEAAKTVQDLGQRLLQTAQQVPGYELPSTAFQNLAAEVSSALQGIASVAGQGRSAEEIQSSIEALNQQQSDQLASIDTQIAALNDSQTGQLALIDAAIEAERQQTIDQLASIDSAIQAEQANLQMTLQEISAREQAAMDSLTQLQVKALTAIQNELAIQMDRLRVEQKQAADALQAVIGDKTYEQFVAEKQQEAVTALQQIDQTLKDYLGTLIAGLFPGAALPSHAGGLDYVPRDNYVANLHRGERVLTASEAAAYQSGGSGSDTIVFSPTITITADRQTDARKLADELETALVDKLRTGSRLRRAVKDMQQGNG
jgi:PAS domain-containing protein